MTLEQRCAARGLTLDQLAGCAGVPLAEVAQLAGHANPQITASLYVHAVNRNGRAATAQLAAFYQQAMEDADQARDLTRPDAEPRRPTE